jgi:hypothetical protein
VVHIETRGVGGYDVVKKRYPLTGHLTGSRNGNVSPALLNQNLPAGVAAISVGVDPVPKEVAVVAGLILALNLECGQQKLKSVLRLWALNRLCSF